MEVLMIENNKDRGNAEPYILSRRCRPHEVLLYVIILPGAATALAARSATLASSYGGPTHAKALSTSAQQELSTVTRLTAGHNLLVTRPARDSSDSTSESSAAQDKESRSRRTEIARRAQSPFCRVRLVCIYGDSRLYCTTTCYATILK